MTTIGNIGQSERATQNRVIALFRDELGYRHLGDWSDRDGNSNIEEGLLTEWLLWYGYTQAQIAVAMHKLRMEAETTIARSTVTIKKSISCCAMACR